MGKKERPYSIDEKVIFDDKAFKSIERIFLLLFFILIHTGFDLLLLLQWEKRERKTKGHKMNFYFFIHVDDDDDDDVEKIISSCVIRRA